MTSAPRLPASLAVITITRSVAISVLDEDVERFVVHRKIVFMGTDNGECDVGSLQRGCRTVQNHGQTACFQNPKTEFRPKFPGHGVQIHRAAGTHVL
ncbi:hypothetical protein GMO_24880 [Gluconobacter morbifer G707]|uniref:Uncharacterized protein n=1 Tax=Gluconobacter morbifer G707 TaxID=1088869 RepID=G6XL65_9PROT|nr:hypothetical protein GMO_24880 [Gluconobacter morbifer G707]